MCISHCVGMLLLSIEHHLGVYAFYIVVGKVVPVCDHKLVLTDKLIMTSATAYRKHCTPVSSTGQAEVYPHHPALFGQWQRAKCSGQDQEHVECGCHPDHARPGRQVPPAGSVRGLCWDGEPVEGGVGRDWFRRHSCGPTGRASGGRGDNVAVW